MGVNFRTSLFLTSCQSSNTSTDKVDFSRTLTLGRAGLHIPVSKYDILLKMLFGDNYTKEKYNKFVAETNKTTVAQYPDTVFAEPFFKLLGAKIIDSIDYSDYESATIIHDMSVPVPDYLKNKYTCVYDGGLLEHVYDYPTALKNAMDMVELGGHIVLVTPGNNVFGHGFYQFSPELFYSILREENGFTSTKVYCCDSIKGKKWYLISNPRDIRSRTNIVPKWRHMYLFVVSQKISEVSRVTAYQSDYEAEWASSNNIDVGNSNGKSSIYINLKKMQDRLPTPIRNATKVVLGTNRKKFNSMFKRVDI